MTYGSNFRAPRPSGWKRLFSEAPTLAPARRIASAMTTSLKKNKGLGKLYKS